MSKIFVDQVDPKTGTSLTLGTSGDTVNIPSGVTLANAGTVTGLPASAISSGTIATARLGSGTASSSTFLRGDQTYAAAGGNTPQFMVVKTSSQSISNNSATKVTWDSELVDSDNTFASDKFTVPAGGGTYLIFSTLLMDSKNNSDLKNCYIKLYKNGSLLQQHVYDFRSNQPRRMAIDLTGVHTLSASDYLEMYAQIDSDDGDIEVDGASSGDGYLSIFGGIKV